MTAGLETLRILKEDPEIYTRLEYRAKMLAEAAVEAGGDSISVNRLGSLMSIFFRSGGVNDYEQAAGSDTKAYADYFGYMLDHGIYLAPSQFEAMFVSDAHTEEDILKTCEVMQSYLQTI